MRWLAYFTVMAFLGLAGQACQAETLNAYAGPSTWGPECPLKAHLGVMTYKLAYKADGASKVVGKIKYTNAAGKVVTSEFNGAISITTGNFVGQPVVQFRGVPTGAAVKVDVSP